MRIIKFFIVFAFFCFITNTAKTQTVFFEDFEGDVSRWTLHNGSEPFISKNKWVIGYAYNLDNNGSKAAFISDNGGQSCHYTNYMLSDVYLYCDVFFPANEENFVLSFDWAAGGMGLYGHYDYMRVYLCDDLQSLSTPIGLFFGSAWQRAAIFLNNCAGKTKRLVFNWYNGGSNGGFNPPVAIDNIKITAGILSQTVHVNEPGTLCNFPNIEQVAYLTVTGNIDARDIRFMRDNMPLVSVDMKNATIKACDDLKGTDNTSPENVMPEYSFHKDTGYSDDKWSKSSLESIILPENLTEIGSYAFKECKGLINITLPSSLKKIGYAAFENCEKLVSIELNDELSEIDSRAFASTGLQCVKNLRTDPIEISLYTFSSNGSPSSYYGKTLIVKESSIDLYKNEEVWKLFNVVSPQNVNFSAASNDATFGNIIAPENGTYQNGTTICLKAIPNNGFFMEWKKNGVSVSKELEYHFALVNNTEIRANFLGIKEVFFEDDFEQRANWTLVNGTEENKWVIGKGTSNGGKKSLHISDDGETFVHNTLPSIVHAYCDIQIPSSSNVIYLKFDWKANGFCFGNQTDGEFYSYLSVRLVDESITPIAGTQLSEISLENLCSKVEWQRALIDISQYSGQNKRLVFTWENVELLSIKPPAAIDNVKLFVSNNVANGFTDIFNESNLIIFPNPAKDEIYIKSESIVEKVEIYSVIGNLLLLENNFKEKISISSLPPSIYLLKIYTEKGPIFSKFVKY